MYSLYLYSDWHMKRNGSQYGFWTGKSYLHGSEYFPVCSTSDNKLQKKWYKSLKRAITSGGKAFDKYGYVTGFDVEDEEGNIVYRSYKDSDVIDKSDTNNYTPIEVESIPIAISNVTVNEKIQMLIDKYQQRLDNLEVLTSFTFEDGKREVLESVIADLRDIKE